MSRLTLILEIWVQGLPVVLNLILDRHILFIILKKMLLHHKSGDSTVIRISVLGPLTAEISVADLPPIEPIVIPQIAEGYPLGFPLLPLICSLASIGVEVAIASAELFLFTEPEISLLLFFFKVVSINFLKFILFLILVQITSLALPVLLVVDILGVLFFSLNQIFVFLSQFSKRQILNPSISNILIKFFIAGIPINSISSLSHFQVFDALLKLTICHPRDGRSFLNGEVSSVGVAGVVFHVEVHDGGVGLPSVKFQHFIELEPKFGFFVAIFGGGAVGSIPSHQPIDLGTPGNQLSEHVSLSAGIGNTFH